MLMRLCSYGSGLFQDYDCLPPSGVKWLNGWVSIKMCKYHGHLEPAETILTGMWSDACDSLFLLFTLHGEICCKSLVSPSLLSAIHTSFLAQIEALFHPWRCGDTWKNRHIYLRKQIKVRISTHKMTWQRTVNSQSNISLGLGTDGLFVKCDSETQCFKNML